MRNRLLMPALVLAIAAGCNGPLDVKSKNTIPTETAITDSASAHAAVAGMYHGLQSLNSYGEEIPEMGDLSADNAEFSGTSTSYGEIDDNQITTFNTAVLDLWSSSYDNINRANAILDKVGAAQQCRRGHQVRDDGRSVFRSRAHVSRSREVLWRRADPAASHHGSERWSRRSRVPQCLMCTTRS